MIAYSVYDEKAEFFTVPFFASNTHVAVRSLDRLVNDDSTTVHQFPDDFTLYEIGKFDQDTGLITPLDKPKFIIKATTLYNNVAMASSLNET